MGPGTAASARQSESECRRGETVMRAGSKAGCAAVPQLTHSLLQTVRIPAAACRQEQCGQNRPASVVPAERTVQQHDVYGR